MAIMIPDALSPDIKSNAEKHIFDWFKHAAGTEEWVVLHSLGIVSHVRVLHGETDFLVIAPGLGMFALEVKGGRVERRLGKWRFINRYGDFDEKIRGPFDQAWEGIYSIRTAIDTKIDNNHQHLRNIIFGVGVMFPDIEYRSIGVDEEQWQVFDINDGKNVKQYIERLAAGSRKNYERLGYSIQDDMLPSKDDVAYLADILRGNFDIEVPLKIKQKYAEADFLTLTNEQALCIEQLSDNQRSLIRGTAGTGKTLLAIEAAKRASAEGERVAFFCYNRLLGEWLEQHFSEVPKNQQPVYVGSFHSYMSKLLIVSGVNTGTRDRKLGTEYFRNILPDEILNSFDELPVRFDKIIVDEAQDLINDKYLDVMDLSLKNGFAQGRWLMFGDFSMQAIYSSDMSEAQYMDKLQGRTSFAIFRLTRNCRNTKKICIDIENIVGIPENAAFKDRMDTPAVDHIIYSDIEDQKQKLVGLLDDLLDKNIKKSDIVILSPRKFPDSVVSKLEGISVSMYSVEPAAQIRFSTIHAFKGLESSSVILTDVESYEDEKLIYTGLSRARFDLHVLESQQACTERTELFFKRRLSNV